MYTNHINLDETLQNPPQGKQDQIVSAYQTITDSLVPNNQNNDGDTSQMPQNKKPKIYSVIRTPKFHNNKKDGEAP